MIGGWTAGIARRVLREETYRLAMKPAIADAAFESAGTERLTSPHRLALILTLILAALHDLRQDLRATYGGRALRTVWIPAMGWASIYAGASLWATKLWATGAGLSWPAMVVLIIASVVPVMIAPAVFQLARRKPTPARSIVAATVAMTTAAVITNLALRAVLRIEFVSVLEPRYVFESARMLALVPLVGLVGLSLSNSTGWRVGGRLAVIMGGCYLAKALLLTTGARGVPVDLVALLLVTSASLCVRSSPSSRGRCA